MTGRTKRWIATAATLAIVGYLAMAAPPPRSIRDFDPVRLADLETRMWQAYYQKQRVHLFGLLVTMLREQYGYSWATATNEAFHLARAAATFGDARSDYERVLPDLEHAYRTAKRHHGSAFDPAALAKAELAWWVARRIPGQNSPKQVGRLIADEYAMLYDEPREELVEAGVLRAEAGELRDRQADNPDWPTIHRMLDEAYRELWAALRWRRIVVQ